MDEGPLPRNSVISAQPGDEAARAPRQVNWWAIAGWTVGVAATFTTWWFSIREPNLTFTVNPTRTVVVRHRETTRLSVLVDGHPSQSDVSAAQVVFWNRGNEPLRPNMNLEAMTIRTEPPVPIVEVRVKNISRSVTGIRIDKSKAEAGCIAIDWRLLEKGDGAALQIVYAGDSNVSIVPSGIFEGQPKVNTIEFPSKDVGNDFILPAMVGLFGAVLGTFVAFLTRRWAKPDTSLEELRAALENRDPTALEELRVRWARRELLRSRTELLGSVLAANAGSTFVIILGGVLVFCWAGWKWLSFIALPPFVG